MMKSIKAILKSDRERYTVPKRVQDLIPVKKVWQNGIFQVGNGKYCQTYRFSDINYLVASREDQEKMLLSYSALLNSLDSGFFGCSRTGSCAGYKTHEHQQTRNE